MPDPCAHLAGGAGGEEALAELVQKFGQRLEHAKRSLTQVCLVCQLYYVSFTSILGVFCLYTRALLTVLHAAALGRPPPSPHIKPQPPAVGLGLGSAHAVEDSVRACPLGPSIAIVSLNTNQHP